MGKQLTYQELLAAYNKLLMENEYLHKEVDRLQSLLSSKGASSTLPAMKQHLSLEEKVDVFRNLFKGREDVFARRWYSRQAENPATSLCAGTNGTGNYVTRKSISVRNVPTGRLNRWSMRISTGILKEKARKVRT